MSGYYEFARPEIQKLVPLNAKRILDVGCAKGFLGKAVKQRQACHITGVEYVPEIAGAARENLDHVICGDIEILAKALPRHYYDCIILADVLEHLKYPGQVLLQLRECLTADGIFIISLPNVRHWSVLGDLLEGKWNYVDAGILDKTHLRFFTRASMLDLFNSTGLVVCHTEEIIDHGFPVPENIISRLNALGLHTGTLAAEVKVVQYLFIAAPDENFVQRSGNDG